MAEGLMYDPKSEIARLEQQIAALQGGGQQAPGGPAPGGPAQGGPGLNQIYGLMAQYADNPAAVGNQFVQAQNARAGLAQAAERTQLQAEDQRDPFRIYGNVNPYDFTPESLEAFEQKRRETGLPSFGLLERKEDLSTKEQGFLNEAIKGAQDADVRLNRMSDLAQRFEQAAPDMLAGRIAGGLGEWAKGMLGGEDELTQLKTEYKQLRNSSVIQQLPPGVASDRDIAIAMEGWPRDTADPMHIASFMRGMQKLAAIDRARSQHSANYISAYSTQQGQLSDWNRNREYMISEALAPYGGVAQPGQGNPPGVFSPQPTAPQGGGERDDAALLRQYGIE